MLDFSAEKQTQAPVIIQSKLEQLFRSGCIHLKRGDARQRVKDASTRLDEDDLVFIPRKNLTSAVEWRTRDPPSSSSKSMYNPLTWLLFKGQHFLAINKPAGLPCHPGTNSNGLSVLSFLPRLQLEQPQLPRLVHRLDKPTSGVLLLARNTTAARFALTLFSRVSTDHKLEKVYWAAVNGKPLEDTGVFTDPEDGGITQFRVLNRSRDHSLAFLELKPLTGRKRQLRRACAALGCPILGDNIARSSPLAGSAAAELTHEHSKSLFLHARSLQISNLSEGDESDASSVGGFAPVRAEAPLPQHMAAIEKYFQ